MEWLPVCPFHQMTGLYCPGCGVTRMLWLLVHGHPLLAVRENALVAVLLVAALVWLVAGRTRAGTARSPGNVGWTAIGVMVVLFTVARNLPIEPFRWLAPVPLADILR